MRSGKGFWVTILVVFDVGREVLTPNDVYNFVAYHMTCNICYIITSSFVLGYLFFLFSPPLQEDVGEEDEGEQREKDVIEDTIRRTEGSIELPETKMNIPTEQERLQVITERQQHADAYDGDETNLNGLIGKTIYRLQCICVHIYLGINSGITRKA